MEIEHYNDYSGRTRYATPSNFSFIRCLSEALPEPEDLEHTLIRRGMQWHRAKSWEMKTF